MVLKTFLFWPLSRKQHLWPFPDTFSSLFVALSIGPTSFHPIYRKLLNRDYFQWLIKLFLGEYLLQQNGVFGFVSEQGSAVTVNVTCHISQYFVGSLFYFIYFFANTKIQNQILDLNPWANSAFVYVLPVSGFSLGTKSSSYLPKICSLGDSKLDVSVKIFVVSPASCSKCIMSL